tara:strand:+ start:44311 stop:44463 length:153 start_codon:yes stop_codon:yes gene_type:complete
MNGVLTGNIRQKNAAIGFPVAAGMRLRLVVIIKFLLLSLPNARLIIQVQS